MAKDSVPWCVLAGFGGHVKATPTTLTIQYKGDTREYPLSSVEHLLLVGGHHLHTSVVHQMLKMGSSISFFNADGTPLGVVRPFGSRIDEERRALQESAPPYAFAAEIATTSLRTQLTMLEETEHVCGSLFYEGELDFLYRSLHEFKYLIKMDELRRLHKLTSDMYYEIMARTLPPHLQFRRRTTRPHRDPINALLSLGYALLFGNCCVAAVGAHLDPDLGMLHQGHGSLVNDLIVSLKPRMIDEPIFCLAREGIGEEEFDVTGIRCHLEDSLLDRCIDAFHQTIRQDVIDQNVMAFCRALTRNEEFRLVV
jgi:CRISPR-associated protein Cas1